MARDFFAVAEELILRINRHVRQRLESLELVAPTYAVALSPLDDIYPLWLAVGLEPDRERALASSSPLIAFSSVWQQDEFAIVEELDEDETIAELITRFAPELNMPEVADGLDATQFVLYNVARRLTVERPSWPVTDDFAVFAAYTGDIADFLLDSLRYSLTPELADRLRAKQLHPDNYERWVDEWLETKRSDQQDADGQHH